MRSLQPQGRTPSPTLSGNIGFKLVSHIMPPQGLYLAHPLLDCLFPRNQPQGSFTRFCVFSPPFHSGSPPSYPWCSLSSCLAFFESLWSSSQQLIRHLALCCLCPHPTSLRGGLHKESCSISLFTAVSPETAPVSGRA